MEKTRKTRLENQIIEELTLMLQREIKDPRARAVSLTKVDLAVDGRSASVFFTPFSLTGETPSSKECLEGLRSASGFLKRRLGKLLDLRRIPDLHFKKDAGHENTFRVREILNDQAFHNDSPSSSTPS